MTGAAVDPWLRRWRLTLDGQALERPSGAIVAPVRRGDAAAMLKIGVTGDDEQHAVELMAWYGGLGAARVLEREAAVVLLERATGVRDLAAMACEGRDDEATRIICGVVRQLHQARGAAPPRLQPLANLFRPLRGMAEQHGEILLRAADGADLLLAESPALLPLHGDVHHRNILDGGARGWFAIDPRGVLGPAEFDYANLFSNPDIDEAHDPKVQVATSRQIFERRLSIVADGTGLEPRRLALWALAYAGLWAAWSLSGGGAPTVALKIAEIAAASEAVQ